MKALNLFEFPWFVVSINDKRLNKFYSIFNKSNLKIPFKFHGFTMSNLNGFENNMLSHAALARMAKTLNFPGIVVFEDDAYPCNEIESKLKSIKEIPDDCGSIMLGWIQNDNVRMNQDLDFFRPYGASLFGMHSYVLLNSGYNSFLNYFSTTKLNSDWYFWKCRDNGIYYYKDCLFIQYNDVKSIGGHYGYRYKDGLAHNDPPYGYLKVDYYQERQK